MEDVVQPFTSLHPYPRDGDVSCDHATLPSLIRQRLQASSRLLYLAMHMVCLNISSLISQSDHTFWACGGLLSRSFLDQSGLLAVLAYNTFLLIKTTDQ